MATVKEIRAVFRAEIGDLRKKVQEAKRSFEDLDKSASGRLSRVGNAVTSASNELGKFGQRTTEVGSYLTKRITAPALVATTAIGGMVASFGWGRLVSLDNAQAKLRGLGYETEDVGRISDQVTSAIETGMTTMGEGVDIAAGALASGVEEGAELERYIRLVGDAAVGSNRPVGEMAQIFNRVQGAGKLMTQELNQIEHGMPGFSNALAKHLGVAPEEMRKMVTAGEVTSEDFLDVMDDFAGGMAEAYANSWQGMVANTKNYIGILGENLLKGVFEQSKDSIAEFIELLKSEQAQEWARETGEKISVAFGKVINAVKGGIKWFISLSDTQKRLIGFFLAVVVSVGPLLMAFGKIITVVSTVGGFFGKMLSWLGLLSKNFKSAGTVVGAVAKTFPKLTKAVKFLIPAFKLLTGPIGIAIAVITGLGVAFVTAYKKSDTFRNFIDGIGEKVKGAIGWIRDFSKAIAGIWSGDAFDQEGAMDLLHHLGLSDEQVKMVFDVVENIKSAYESLKERAKENLEMIKETFTNIFNQIKDWWDSSGKPIFDDVVKIFNRVKDDISKALGGVKDFFISIFEDIGAWWSKDGEMIFDAIGTVFESVQSRGEKAWSILSKAIEIAIDVITGIIDTFAPIVMGIFNKLWPMIVYLTQTAWEKIKLAIGIAMDLIMGIISGVSAIIEGDWKKFGEVLKDTAKSIWDRVVEFFGNMKDNALELINDLTGGAVDKFIEMRDGVIEWVLNLIEKALFEWERLKKYTELAISTMVHNVKQFFIDLWDGVKETVTNIRDGVVDRFTQLKERVTEKVDEIFGPTIQTFKDIYDAVTSKVEEIRVTLSEIWKRIKIIITSTVKGIYNSVKEWFLNIYNDVKDRITNLKDRLNEIWTSIRNRIVEVVKNIYNRVKDWFLRIFNNVDERTKGTRKRVTELWRSLRDRVVNTVRNLYNRVKDWFLRIYNNIRDRVISIRNTAVNWFTRMRDTVVSRVRTLYNRVSGWFSDIYTSIHNKMRDAKNKAVGFAEDLYEGAKDEFRKLVTASKDMMDDIGGWIDQKKNAVVGKARSLGTSIANAAIRGFNSLIGGINKVADFLGVSKKNQISKIGLIGGTSGNVRGSGYRAIRASKGLKNHKGGDVLVGDKGPGNTIGGGSSTREIVQLPDGKNFLMDGNVMLRNPPKGLRVHSNKDTEAILASNPDLNPDLTGGSGALSILNNMIRPVTRMVDNQQKTAKVSHDVTSDIMAYADDPAQLAKDVIAQFTSFDLPKVPFDIAWAGIKNTTTAMGKKFKQWFDDFNSGGDGSHILGKKILQTFGRYTGGIGFNGGKHYGIDTAHKFDPLLSPVNGKVSRVWRDYGGGNSLQITTDKYIWWFMHLSKIMKKVGDTVRAGMRLGTTGNSGNFVVGSGHLHTQVHPRSKGAGNRNAINPLPVLKNLKGYFRGGITSGFPELAWLNEEGFKESVISHNPSHRNRSHEIWNQTGNMLGFNDGNDQVVKELKRANELNEFIIDAIYDSGDKTLEMDKEAVGRIVAPVVKRRNDYRDRRRNKFNK